MRRPRAGLVTPHPGGPGEPSGLTTGVCLQWLHVAPTKAGESPPDSDAQKASVGRREARPRSAIASGEDTFRRRVGWPRRPLREPRKLSRFPALRSPRSGEWTLRLGMTAHPAPQRTRAAERWLRWECAVWQL